MNIISTENKIHDYNVSKLRVSLSQICAVMVKNLLLVVFGMTIGFTTILIPHLSKQSPDEDIYLDQTGISWIGSLGNMCVPFGCLFSGAILDSIGRKRSMQLVCIPYFACCIGYKYSSEVWQIFLGLAVTGVASGLLEAPIVTYVAEVTTPQLRGILSATGSLAFHVGLLVEFTLGKLLSWRDAALVTSIGPLMCFFLLFVIPESPRWLIKKERYDDAKKSLAWLRGWTTVTNVEREFQDIMSNDEAAKVVVSSERFVFDKYCRRNFILPLALMFFMFFVTCFSGSVVMQTFAVNIFEIFQSPINKYTATILYECAELLGSFIGIVLINYVGKRVLMFQSLGIGSLCMTGCAVFAFVAHIEYFNPDKNSSPDFDIGYYKWFPLCFILIAAFAFQSGIRMIPWILMGEIFSSDQSPIGTGLSAAIAHILGFASKKIFLDVVSLITIPGAFWLNGAVGVLGLIVLYFWMPETEGKTLEEISNHFSGTVKLDNKVRRKLKTYNSRM